MKPNWTELHAVLSKYCIAWKLWTVEDIEMYLIDHGYPATEENVETLLNHMNEDGLSDCNDYDWEVFAQALWDCKDELKKEE